MLPSTKFNETWFTDFSHRSGALCTRSITALTSIFMPSIWNNHDFILCLTSVAPIIIAWPGKMVERLTWNKAVAVCATVPILAYRNWVKPGKLSIRIVRFPVGIRTQHRPNTSQKRHRLNRIPRWNNYVNIHKTPHHTYMCGVFDILKPSGNFTYD
jgi:hypothetical protein